MDMRRNSSMKLLEYLQDSGFKLIRAAETLHVIFQQLFCLVIVGSSVQLILYYPNILTEKGQNVTATYQP